MNLPHHIEHEDFCGIVGFLKVNVFVGFVYLFELLLLVEGQSCGEEGEVLQVVVDGHAGGFSVGTLEEVVTVEKVDWEH